jgi:hypothetical protein
VLGNGNSFGQGQLAPAATTLMIAPSSSSGIICVEYLEGFQPGRP